MLGFRGKTEMSVLCGHRQAHWGSRGLYSLHHETQPVPKDHNTQPVAKDLNFIPCPVSGHQASGPGGPKRCSSRSWSSRSLRTFLRM